MSSKVRSTLLFVAALAISVPSLQAQAGGPAKVAIIDAAKAVVDTAEFQKIQAAVEAKYRPRQQAIEDLDKQLDAIQKQGVAPNIPPDKQAQLQEQFTVKQKQRQRLAEDLQADINAERQDVLGKTGRQMAEVVKKLAEEKGIDVVVDARNTIYFKPALEITAEATAAYNKAYPAK
jgi:outer membrane protein